jgi:aryl-alcohol dehydrogenase-like predicted oxidoreductase
LVDLSEVESLAFLPWGPIRDVANNRALRQLGERHGATPTQLALAWLLARSPAMLPIPGTGSVSHLEENIAAAAIRLDAGEVAQLTEAIA